MQMCPAPLNATGQSLSVGALNAKGLTPLDPEFKVLCHLDLSGEAFLLFSHPLLISPPRYQAGDSIAPLRFLLNFLTPKS